MRIPDGIKDHSGGQVSEGRALPWVNARWHQKSGIGDPKGMSSMHFKLANSKILRGKRGRGLVDWQVTWERS
jgi:hypothetical protein